MRSALVILVMMLSCCLAVSSASAAIAADGSALANADFEGAFTPAPNAGKPNASGSRITGAIGEGWDDNSSWADVDIDYSSEKTDPHGGKAAQRVHVTRFASGGVQFIHPVRFKAGVGVRFSVWLRGRPGQSVGLMLRQADAPWTTYASASASLSPEWREFSVRGVPQKDEAGFLMIRAGEPMSFDVDDAKLEDLASVAGNAPAKVGNLIVGGSFETDRPPFGWTTRQTGDPDWVWGDVHQRIDEIGQVGSRSLRIDLQAAGSNNETHSPVFIPNGDRVHVGSVWLKSSEADTPVRIAFDNTQITSDVRVGTEWQRCVVSGKIPFIDWSRLRVSAQPHATKAISLWVDGAMVEERAEPSVDYLAGAPTEVALDLDLPGHILHDGKHGSARLALAPAPPTGSTLELSVEDLLGGTTKLPALSLPADHVALPELPNRPHGMFKLRAVVRDAAGKALSQPTELIWSRLPPSRDIAPEKSYFGLHIPLTPDYIAMARAAGMRWIRFHDTCMIGKWPVAEVAPGTWNFFDRQVDAAHAAGLGIIGMYDGAPARTASRKREGGYWGIWHIPDLPGAMDEWRGYVRAVTTHYRGKIDHWEIWNEPWGEWWLGAGGTPELYADLMKAAYSEAKKANPEVTVIGVDTYRGAAWTELVLKASGTDCFDAFSFHDYNDALYGGSPSFAQRQVDGFAASQAKFGTPKPQWNTEGGLFGCGSWYVSATGGMTPRGQVAFAIRYDVTMLAAGVKAYVMYGIHTDGAMGEIECRDDEHDRAIKPVVAARSMLAALIDGVGTPVRSEPEPGVDCYAFPAEGRTRVGVWWANDGQDHRLPVPAGAEVLDALGSPMTVAGATVTVNQEPVYVITKSP